MRGNAAEALSERRYNQSSTAKRLDGLADCFRLAAPGVFAVLEMDAA